ncbi:MAG: amino acid aminotransferase [Xanthomonadales bacterium]|jgi:aspartate aminotransferase|nr:amino acid aminotransferase [Xanthomonadales bacterium]
MLQHLNALPADPILGLIAAHAADSNPKKIDLGIGVYKDEQGNTPILRCVKQAERLLLEQEQSKTYLGPPGVAGFNSAIADLVFGADSDTVRSGRVQTIQTPGGTGALRVAGDLVQTARPGATIWMSDPTWANHIPVFSAAGLKMESYPYFDPATSSLRYDDMMTVLQERVPGEIVLFHGCCHNPCGVSPDPEQWETISDVAAERGFTPMIDLAYQGFERGIEEDALAVRLFAEKCPEVIVASSCSKNFAVYRERTGAISVVCKTGDKAKDVVTVINSLTRQNYSMPPTHGPAAIDIILHSEELTALWREEVTDMRDRINGLRSLLVEKIAAAGIERDFSFLERQSGMFSFMGLSVEQVQRLRDEFSIYTVNSARVNIASFNDGNIDYFVEALQAVLEA